MNTGPLALIPDENCAAFAFIGSQVIPGAATEASDTDIAVLLIEGADREDIFDQIITAAQIHKEGNDCVISDGEGYGGSDGDGMTSCKIWRDGKVWNYLVFTDGDYFDKFVDCTTLAIRFGIVDKPFRVELFQMMCDGYRKSDGHFEHVKIHRPDVVPF